MNSAATPDNGLGTIDPWAILGAIGQSGQAIIITDIDGTIIYAAPGIEMITGYSREELVSKDSRIFKSGRTDSAVYKGLWSTIHSGAMWSGCVRIRKKNGEGHQVRLAITPILDGNRKIVLFCAHNPDVKQNRTGDRESDTHASATKTKNMLSFFSKFIQEIRSSMNASKGFTELLVENMTNSFNPVQRDYLSIIRQTNKRMMNTLEDGLTLARLDADDVSMHLEPVQVANELKNVLSELAIVIERFHIRLIKVIEDKGALISVDRVAFKQILSNLISNAVKFSEPGGFLMLGVNVYNSHALITIVDTGVGISESFKAHVFKPFCQEEIGNYTEYEGAGLGLAITRRLIEIMGGSIGFDSRKNGGTSFMIRFPVVGWTSEIVASHVVE